MVVVQFLVPVYDRDGRPYPRQVQGQIQRDMEERFDGWSLASDQPLPGAWRNPATGALDELPKEDLAYLLALQRRAMESEDYFVLQRAVCASGAYPLKGSPRVTREVHTSTLFRVAEDIVDRVGIEQGVIAPAADDEVEITDQIMGTAEAAERLGITRHAVVKAAQAGRLKGKKIGNTWALLRRSVEGYEVARHRVEAARAASRR